jgi:acetyl esterase/lipase
VSERLSYRALLHALWTLRGKVPGERAPTESKVRYRAHPLRGIAPHYDVYLPERPSGDSVVMVHGGGFAIGARDMKPMRRIAASLLDRGFAVCSVDYRMIFRGGRLDESLDDVTLAFEHFRAETYRRGLDPARVSILGLSAGATLALLAAARTPVRRVVSCFGLYELDHLNGPLAALIPRLVFRSTDRALWAARSPRGATQPTAPTLLLHGTADGLVPYGQAERLAAHRRSLDLPTELVLYPGAPHGFFNEDKQVAIDALDAIGRFLLPSA